MMASPDQPRRSGVLWSRAPEDVRPPERMRIVIAICCGVIQIVLAKKFCPESCDPVVYWPLPLFHLIWHPFASVPNPIACFAGLVLNAIILSSAVFVILGLLKKI